MLLPRVALLSLLLISSAFSQGSGLTGQYYDTASFTTLKTTRTDASVNFAWGTAIPSGTALTGADTFSVAWSGQIEPEFSALYTFYLTADDGAQLWIDDRLVAQRWFNGGSGEIRGQARLTAGRRVNIRLEYVEQTGSASVKLEWSCGYRTREVVPTARLYPNRVDKAGGALLGEHWSAVSGSAITALTSLPDYPGKPTARELLTSFECLTQNWADDYGTRVTGHLVPPTSGSYRFAVSGDEAVELYLSTDESSANKALIASSSSPTTFRNWGTSSTPVTLTQGLRYYVEMLHKEGPGDDHWSVGWTKPGDTGFSVVPGSALCQPGLTTAQPAQAALLNTMAQGHPRIFASQARFAALKAAYLSSNSSLRKTWATSTITSANSILSQAPVTYSPDVRGTILDEARTVKDRMYRLAVAWWLTDDPQYAERAWTELSTVADNALFPDWHPAHFLDTAELTHACAIGYDWFYPYWTQARRDTIRAAILTKGLTPGLTQYANNVGWSQSTGNNWNMVCNGGLTMGALAVGTESESIAEDILNRAINSTRPVWKHFTTDNGAWYEGPGYWGYTTEYGIRMLAALEWVLGSDFGISSTQALSETGFAPIHALGSSNVIFNFADASAGGAQRGAIFQWLARRYNQPLYDWWANQASTGSLEALWWNASDASLASTNSPPDMAFHGESGTAFQPQEMVTLRARWNDSRATFVATKGGQMGADHGNLDAGTFVLDALGKRWFHDLGGDDYALPGYFSSSPSTGTDRWDYYRLRPEGQNTLTINPSANADMVLNATAPLIAYQSEPAGSGSFAIHDLTAVYSGMTRVWRGTRLLGNRGQLLVQDEIQAASGKTVWWFAHYTSPATTVTLDPDGTGVLLTQGAERLWCKIASGGGTFQILDAVPLATSPNPAGQNANTGYKKLAIQFSNVTDLTLAVWFVPLSAGDAVPQSLPAIVPLNTWNLANSNDAPLASTATAAYEQETGIDIDLRNYAADDSTPAEELRFTVGAPLNGSVLLLPDGHTARFTPVPGYTGIPSFTFTATDTAADPDAVLAYDFDLPDPTPSNTIPDVSGNFRDGTVDFAGAGTFNFSTDQPGALATQGARSLDLVETILSASASDATRVQRLLTAADLDWNTSDWSVTGWFKRRDMANDDMVWHVSDGDGFGTNDELYVNCPTGSATVRLQHFNKVAASLDVDLAASATVGAWHHFAAVREGTTLSFYLDGALVGSDPAFALAINQASPVVFGGHASPGFQPGRWFDGQLDDLLITRRPLLASEVAALAQGASVRHATGLTASGSIVVVASSATHVWTNAATGSSLPWSQGANWQSGSPPASWRGASVQFFPGQTLANSEVLSANDFAGTLQMNNLMLSGSGGAGAAVTLSGGSLALIDNSGQLPSVNLAASSPLVYQLNTPISLVSTTTFNASGNGTFVFNGSISGAGGLTRTGTASKLILTGANTYTGSTTITSGTLQIGNDGASGALGSGEVIDNGQLRFDRTGTLEVPNLISGTGSVYVDIPLDSQTKLSLGTLILSGVNSFEGGVTVNSGTLRITNSAALGTGAKTVTLSNGTNGAPQLQLDGSGGAITLPATIAFLTSSAAGAIVNLAGDNLLRGPVTLTGGGGDTKILVSANSLTLEGNIAPTTTSRNLLLDGPGNGTCSGLIANGAGPNVLVSLKKLGAGTWTLAGANTHSGLTTVSAGILMLGAPAALGHGGLQFGNTAGSTSISSGAALDLNGQQGLCELINLAGSGPSGGGCLVNSGIAAASIAGGQLSSISTTSGGIHDSVPEVTVSGGGGAGATAVASLGLTAASFSISGGTTVYSAAPSVAISGGGGAGATASAVLSNGSTGTVTGITLTNPGAGYTSAPTVAFNGGAVSSAGTNPTGTGNALNFTVSGVTVTNPGSGYLSAPSIAFGSGTGTAATANRSAVVLTAASTIGGPGDIRIDAPVSGSFPLTKTGSGTLTLSAANAYTGATTVASGRLVVSGSLTSSLANSAMFAPQGTPVTSGAFSQTSAGTLQLRLTASGGDRFTASSLSLNGALDLIAAPDLPPNAAFTILNNTGTGAVSGTFAGKPNNSTFSASGYTWRISYTGGTGNDVTLTVVASPIEVWRYAAYGSLQNAGAALDTADGDGDGVPNLMEYAAALDPAAKDAPMQTTSKSTSQIEFHFAKSKAATDVTLSVEWSDTLDSGTWSTSGVTTSIVTDDGTIQEMKAVLPWNGSTGRRFVRLKASRP